MGTQRKILDAAERLFADKGFAATSLRSVVAAADVNVAAIHYHFGSKEGLIRAVFARRLGPVNAARLDLLSKFSDAASPRPPRVEEIVEAFVRPAFAIADLEAKQHVLARMFGRLHVEDGTMVHGIVHEQLRDLVARFHSVLREALPGLNETERVYRFNFVIAAMAAMLIAPERIAMLSDGRVAVGDTEATLSYLVVFCSAGLRAAPASDSTTAGVCAPDGKKDRHAVATDEGEDTGESDSTRV